MNEETREWIDKADYEQLMYKWRFAPVGDPIFQGETGRYFRRRMNQARAAIGQAEHVRISKKLGW